MQLKKILSFIKNGEHGTVFFKTHLIDKLFSYKNADIKCQDLFKKTFKNKFSKIHPFPFTAYPFAYPHILRHKNLQPNTQSSLTKTRNIAAFLGR